MWNTAMVDLPDDDHNLKLFVSDATEEGSQPLDDVGADSSGSCSEFASSTFYNGYELPQADWQKSNMTSSMSSPSMHPLSRRNHARIPLSQIKVTSTHSFWTAVTQTADYHNGRLMGWDADVANPWQAPSNDFRVAPLISDFRGTVVLLARTVMQLHGLGGQYSRHSHVMADLKYFLQTAGAVPLPRLEEMDVKNRKVDSVDLYRKYYEGDPQGRVPSLPTVTVPALPGGECPGLLPLPESGGRFYDTAQQTADG
eukprot:jgi/Botrbrau1/17009/Bobra.49_2s0067.1